MEQRLYNWKWSKTVSEVMSSFNEVVHIWNQEAQETATLHFARQVDMPTPHAILDQIVKKMPPWAKKHMQEHPEKYTSVPHLLGLFERGRDCPFDSDNYGQYPSNDSHSSRSRTARYHPYYG